MRSRIGQPELLKEINRASALDILIQTRVLSRPQLAERTGLSRATIAILVDELLQIGLVREYGLGDSGGGRPPLLMEFNPDAALALGARMRDGAWGIVITNLDAQVIHHLDISIPDRSPAAAVRTLCDGVRTIMAQADAARILPAIGVGTPGLVDVHSGVITSAVDMGWFAVPIRDMVEQALGMRTFVANRSKVGALAELWCGVHPDVKDIIYVSIGTGIAAGIVHDGQLYVGVNSSAGELGHVTILPDGPLCPCGNRGCLQQLASGPAIANRARERLRDPGASILRSLVGDHPEWVTPQTVFAAAEQGDALALEIVTEAARYVGIAVANLVNLFNPQLVVIGGPVGQVGQVLMDPLRDEVRRRAMAYPLSAVEIVTSNLGAYAGAIGAAVLVLQQASELIFAKK